MPLPAFTPPALTSIVTLLVAIYYLWVGVHVGMVRAKVKIPAPAMGGDPLLERAVRVQMNAIEFAPVILPALWLAAVWTSDVWAAALGLVWVVARVAYLRAYMADPSRRGPAFLVQMLAAVALIGMALVGVAWALFAG